MTSTEFASDAWLLKGAAVSIPGWLYLREGFLCFVTPDETVFDVPLAEVTSVAFPWYYFGGGVKLKAAGEPYRLSFVKPNGMEYAASRGLASTANPAALLVAATKVADVSSGQDTGRVWRGLLEGPDVPQ